MAVIPYMPLYIADYMADAGHLSTLEHGAYILLIMAYWQRGKPLPASNDRLANLSHLSAEDWRTVKPTLSAFFQERDGLWIHKRIEQELVHFRDKSDKAKRAGRASGHSRSNGRSTDGKRAPNHTSTQDADSHSPLEKEFSNRDTDRTDVQRPLNVCSTDVQRTFNGRSTDAERTLNGRSPITNGRSTDVGSKAPIGPKFSNRDTEVNGRSTDVQRTFNHTDTYTSTKEIPPTPSFEPTPSDFPPNGSGHHRMLAGEEWFEEVYSRHPKKKNRILAAQYLSQLTVDRDEFDRVHLLWCEEWAKDKPQFAPSLADWIVDQGWKYPPNGNSTKAVKPHGCPVCKVIPCKCIDHLIAREFGNA